MRLYCFNAPKPPYYTHIHESLIGVETAQTLAGVLAQVEQNKKDLPAAIAANQAAGVAGGDAGASAINGSFIYLFSHKNVLICSTANDTLSELIYKTRN